MNENAKLTFNDIKEINAIFIFDQVKNIQGNEVHGVIALNSIIKESNKKGHTTDYIFNGQLIARLVDFDISQAEVTIEIKNFKLYDILTLIDTYDCCRSYEIKLIVVSEEDYEKYKNGDLK